MSPQGRPTMGPLDPHGAAIDTGSVTVAHYGRLTQTRASIRTRTWDQLADELGHHAIRAEKGGPLWSPVVFGDDAPKQRANANVAALTAAVVETDHTAPDWSRLDGLAFVAHTTHSHAEDDPHWRIVVALADPVPVADWPEAWARIVAAIAPEADPACKDVSRAYYLPTASPGAPTATRAGTGVPLDWRALPAIAPSRPAAEAEHPAHRHAGPAAAVTAARVPQGSGERPGDVFNRTVDWPEILEPHGWRLERELPDGSRRWVRPGKTAGTSATTDGGGQRVLYVFSSSAPPFDPGESVTRFEAWTRLEHGGDRIAATRCAAERFGLALPERDYLFSSTNEITRLDFPADDLAGVRELPPSDETPEQLVARLTLELAQARTVIAERDHTIAELRDIIGEYRAADQLVKHGPFTPDGAAVHKHLVTVAAATRANGVGRASIERTDVARLALGDPRSVKAVSRALAAYKPYQDDPALAETLPYRLEWHEGGRRTHIDLVPLVVSQREKADAYRTLQRLPKHDRPPTKVRERDESCPRCQSHHGVESRSTKRCLNERCGHTWHTRPVVLGRVNGVDDVDDRRPPLLGAPLPGQTVPARPGLTPAGQTVPATDRVAASNEHARLPAQMVVVVPNGVPGQPVPAPPVSFTSRDDQEAAAGPARVLVPYQPPAPHTGPWRCPPPCGSYERYRRADGSWRCDGCGHES